MGSQRTNPIHPYRLSEYTINSLNTCERFFQLERMILPASTGVDRAPSVPFVRGAAWGAAVQSYLVDGDWDKAIFQLWLAYYPQVYDERKKIFFWRVVNNFTCARDAMDKIRQRYRVAIFNGKPATELSFRLDIDDKWYFVGYIDLVLFDLVDKIYVVEEVKTSTYNLIDLKPIYKNQGQALGYSIAIDKIVGEEQAKYGVNYFVTRDANGSSNFQPDVYHFPFTKTLLDRLRWFYTLKLDVQRLNTMLESNLFPMRGNSCVKYNQVCRHYGTCSFTSADIAREPEVDTVQYDFRYRLDDVIEDHIERVQREVGQSSTESTVSLDLDSIDLDSIEEMEES